MWTGAASLPSLGPRSNACLLPQTLGVGKAEPPSTVLESSVSGTRVDTFASFSFIQGHSGIVWRPEVSNVLRDVCSPLFTCEDEDFSPGSWYQMSCSHLLMGTVVLGQGLCFQMFS